MVIALQFALSNPTPGMSEEFNRWYGSEHLPHTLHVPGVLAGQRFRRTDSAPLPAGAHEYLMVWEFDDPRFALEQLAQVKGGEKMPISPAIDMATLQPPTMWLRATVRSAQRIVTDSSTRGTVLLALVNAKEGEALEAHLLLDGLRGLADLPGVTCAHFLTLADEQIRGNARKFRYALFVELAEEAVAMPAITEALETMPSLDRCKWMASAFRPLGARLTAAGLRT